MFVTEGPSDYYSCSMRHNGALEQRFLIYAFHMAVSSPEARSDPALRLALREARYKPAGGFDQRTHPATLGSDESLPLSARPDVLTSMSEPLQHEMEVTGTITVNLWVSSTAADTDFTAKLVDLYPPSADYPDGYALNLTDSIMRARYRDSYSKPELMRAGEIYRLSFKLYQQPFHERPSHTRGYLLVEFPALRCEFE